MDVAKVGPESWMSGPTPAEVVIDLGWGSLPAPRDLVDALGVIGDRLANGVEVLRSSAAMMFWTTVVSSPDMA